MKTAINWFSLPFKPKSANDIIAATVLSNGQRVDSGVFSETERKAAELTASYKAASEAAKKLAKAYTGKDNYFDGG